MTTQHKYRFCPKCGYTFERHESGGSQCPKCGVKFDQWVKTSPFLSRKFIFISITLLMTCGFLLVMYLTNEGVATEFRQMRQSKPNRFYVGIDVSATIDIAMLEAFKNNIISRLSNFIGDQAVAYNISIFGKPGCGQNSIDNIVLIDSPADQVTFNWEVEKKIETIKVNDALNQGRLTTPLNCFLKMLLKDRNGARIIIFSDLLNDDSDCAQQFIFPAKTLVEFGKNKQGQLIFLYPTPQNKKMIPQQEEFIAKIRAMSNQGQIRTYFYHIPDNPAKVRKFITSKLKDAIPATTFEIIKERVSRVADTIVSAVRG